MSGCIGRCVQRFSVKAGHEPNGRDGSLTGRQGQAIQGLGGMGSKARGTTLITELGTVRRRHTTFPDKSRVSKDCHELGCVHCTSSFVLNMVNDGRSTLQVGRSVGSFLSRDLTLRLSRRGALVARANGSTGFLKCRVAMAQGGRRQQSIRKHLQHACNGHIQLGIDVTALQSGLLRCKTVRVGLHGKGRV